MSDQTVVELATALAEALRAGREDRESCERYEKMLAEHEKAEWRLREHIEEEISAQASLPDIVEMTLERMSVVHKERFEALADLEHVKAREGKTNSSIEQICLLALETDEKFNSIPEMVAALAERHDSLKEENESTRAIFAQVMTKLRTSFGLEAHVGDTLQSVVDVVCARGAVSSVRKVFMHVADVLNVFKAQSIDVVASRVQEKLGDIKEADLIALHDALRDDGYRMTLTEIVRRATERLNTQSVSAGDIESLRQQAAATETLANDAAVTLSKIPGVNYRVGQTIADLARSVADRIAFLERVRTHLGEELVVLQGHGKWTPRKGDVVQYQGRQMFIRKVNSNDSHPYVLHQDDAVFSDMVRAKASELTLIRSANVDDPVEGMEVPKEEDTNPPSSWVPREGDRLLSFDDRMATVLSIRGDGMVEIILDSGTTEIATEETAAEQCLRYRRKLADQIRDSHENWKPRIGDAVKNYGCATGFVVGLWSNGIIGLGQVEVRWHNGATTRNSLQNYAINRERALRDGLRDKPKEELSEAPKQENADEWQPLLNETVVDGSGLEGRVTSVDNDGMIHIQWADGGTSHNSVPLLRAWRKLSIARQREAKEGVYYDIVLGDLVAISSDSNGQVTGFVNDGTSLVEVLWDDGKRYKHDPPLVREWKKLYLKRAREKAAEPPSAGPQEGAPTAAAFDALARENTRLRRKLERVFEALKDSPTEGS